MRSLTHSFALSFLLIALVACSAPSLARAQAGDTASQAAPAATANADTTVPPASRTQVSSDSCQSWGFTATFNCWLWQPFMSSLGAFLLTISASILLAVGALFDQALNYLVIDFQSTMAAANILGGIEIAWQLFRDLANIAIIGVFVFVAVMTIWGSAEYGAKRLVSRVLIVAILLNFSFLFTQAVIESTNLVSKQFARAMPNNAQTAGVAQSFLTSFGIDGVWNTKAVTDRVAAKTDSGWAAFLYGLVGSVFLLLLSGVLLYGAVMICTRALLLIFMMITSSLAFASFLLPNAASRPLIGWSSWWSNLLKAAIFGPILMVLLWIALEIVSKASVSGAGNAVSEFALNPSTLDANAWQQIIFLIIGTGILFMGIRAAGSFAASIGGFNWAAIATLAPLTLGSRFIAAPLGRRYVGLPALARQQELEHNIKQANRNGNFALAAQLQKDYLKASRTAQRDFNVMNTAVAKKIAGVGGVSGFALGDRKLGGAAGIANKAAKETAKELKGLQPSAADIASAASKAADQVHEDNKAILESLKGERDALAGRRDTLAKESRPEKTHVEEQKMLKTVQESAAAGAAQGGLTAQERAAQHERELRAEHKSELDSVTTKISNVHDKLTWANADVVNAQNRISMHEYETGEKAAKAAQKVVDSATAAQKEAARKGLPWLRRNDATVNIAVKQMGKERIADNVRQHLSGLTDEGDAK